MTAPNVPFTPAAARSRGGAVLGFAAAAALAAGMASVALPSRAAAPPVSAPPAAAVPGAQARTYAVQLARPSVVGQKQLAIGALENDDTSSGGLDGAQPVKRLDKATIRFVVASEILEVSPSGNARRAVLTVRRLDKESGGVSVELAKPGELFTARMVGHDRVVEQQGTPVATDLQQALAAAVPLRSDDEPTDDDLYGTATPHRVGDSWPVPGALFASAGAQHVQFDPKQVAGTVTLTAVKPVQGQLCLEVQWKVEAHHGSFKAGGLPGGLLGTLATMTVTGSATVPVAGGLPPLARANVIAAVGDFTGANEDGTGLTIHRDMRQVSHVEFSRIP